MINEKYIICKECISYDNCSSIENKFRNELEENKGNWRALFDSGKRVDSPLRRCTHAVLKTHISKMKDKRVLEVGCGPLSEITLDICKANNIKYCGIDFDRTRYTYVFEKSRYFEKYQNAIIKRLFKMLNIRKYSINRYQSYVVDKFPSKLLDKCKYDVIYGNSTIEHWHEKNKDFSESEKLYQNDLSIAYELLDNGGKLILNCPIHVHGNNLFVYAKLDAIKNIFTKSAEWKNITFEYWRKDHSGLMPYCPEKRKEVYKNDMGIDLTNIWLLNVIAEK